MESPVLWDLREQLILPPHFTEEEALPRGGEPSASGYTGIWN